MDKLKAYMLFGFILNLSISCTFAFWGSEDDDVKPNVLVFGGNGFLGSETVNNLIEAGLPVTVVNRGGKYWDSQERIFSKVKAIKCDRSKPLQFEEECPELVAEMKENKFDFVIDFSVKTPYAMNATLRNLNKKVSEY